MKPSDNPKVSKKWWTSEKPADIKGVELEKALASAEKCLEDAKKKVDGAAIEAALSVGEKVSGTVLAN